MKIKAGIFDLGKVVVHSEDSVSHDFVQETLDLSNSQIVEFTRGVADLVQTGQLAEEEFIKKFLQENNLKTDFPKDLLQITFKRDFKFLDETIEIIKKLREQGIKLAALSNTIPQHVEVMEEAGLYNYFDVRVMSCEVGLKKPDLGIYELTLQRLGVLPREAFFTDDREENIQAAKDLGIAAILFKNAGELREELKKLGLII